VEAVDDLGARITLAGSPRRIVSLVPSLTELLFALGGGEQVVGITHFCTEPPQARTRVRLGGPKNPDLARLRTLRPDLVIANAEENRREDVEALRAERIPVLVTFPRTVDEGIALVRRLGQVIGRSRAATTVATRLQAARDEVRAAVAGVPPRRVLCLIWKRPWMTFNDDTFASSMLAAAGGANVCGELSPRYPVVDAATVAAASPELVLLPSEPYRFTPRDLGELEALFAGLPRGTPAVRFLDGQALTWYGPRIDWGLRLLRSTLGAPGPAGA
jgi:ABC-type Fe3+-hydroxamate transport system substrate-binding protein